MKVVIKIGTQAILAEDGTLQDQILANLVRQIADLQKSGVQVSLVSSGAVASGRRIARTAMGRQYGRSTVEKQLLASLGQHELVHEYAGLFKKYELLCAQLLLTKQDFHTRAHYLNIARLMQEILDHKNIIPVINENDSVAIEELMFTDNDELAGLISAQISADKLIILTSVKGVYDGHPDEPNSKLISVINPQDKWHPISSVKTTHGRGGMQSKMATARKMSGLGITTHIAHVNEDDVIVRIAKGENLGTTILPFKKKSNMKRWLAFHCSETMGSIQVNDCLLEIIKASDKALSIMPVGIVKSTGDFKKGDLINIIAPNGQSLGVGIAKYGAEKLNEYMGNKNMPTFIHYDQLYIEFHEK